jgi:hypothetical protein
MIRKIITLAILFSFILSSCFNGTNVPSLVKKKFKEMYPNIKEVQWVENKNFNFVANFKQEDKNMIASFSKYGIWLESKNNIPETAVPAISISYITQFYPEANITDKFSVKNPDGDFFEVDVKKDTTTFAVIFDKDGKLFRDDNNVLLKNFKKMYPNPSDVKWVRADDGKFDVFFKDQGKVCKVSYAINGNWIESQTLATETEVPAVAFTYIKKAFKAYELKGIIFVKTTDSELFNIVIQVKDKEYNLYFDLEGNFIKKDEALK